MADIVERLRGPAPLHWEAKEAADTITALRAENERLREALWDIHAVCNNWDWFIWMWPIRRIKRIARAAITQEQGK